MSVKKQSFSICKTTTPRLKSSQIHICSNGQVKRVGISKPAYKLKVGRTGKIGYSK